MIAHAPLPTVPVLPTHDGVRAGPTTDDIAAYITNALPQEDWGEAFILATRIMPRYDPGRLPFSRYFWVRWKYHKADQERNKYGRARNRDGKRGRWFSKGTSHERQRALAQVRSTEGRKPRVQKATQISEVHSKDVIETVIRRAGRTHRQRLIVRCLAGGLDLSDAARAAGYTQSMVSLVWNKEGLAQRVKEVIEEVAA